MGNLADKSEILYHVGFCADDLKGAEWAVLPGDPGRVQLLAENLGEAKFIACHREYTSWLAQMDCGPVLVCSTGMGGPSTAICLEELARMGIKGVIRVGTTGTIQEKISIGDLIINNAAVRLDGTSQHYAPLNFPAVADIEITNALRQAAIENDFPCHTGISVSSDTFWPGQERYDSFSGYVRKSLRGTLQEWQKLGALNYEMETSALFVVSQCLGLKAGAVCSVVAKRTDSEAVVPLENKGETTRRFWVTVKRALQLLLKAGE